jgi:tight adherence protein B
MNIEMNIDLITKIGGYFSPFFVASIAAGLAFFGWRSLESEIALSFRKRNLRKSEMSNQKVFESGKERGKPKFLEISAIVLVGSATFLISLLLTSSKEISFSIALLSSAAPLIVSKKKLNKLERERERSWPEAIENIVSALQAGQSIAEALGELTLHGPIQLRPIFRRIQNRILNGITLEESILIELKVLENAVADQTLISLLIAKEYGGRDVTTTLRLLAAFLREQDEAIEEIETRFGWVKNSALLGTIAPWLLLGLLSTQRNTILAYATPAGRTVLSIGVIATGIAYIWMDRVAKLPEPARLIGFDFTLNRIQFTSNAKSIRNNPLNLANPSGEKC